MGRPLETLTIRTLLGIRFWDPATDQRVSDGLELVAWPEAAPELKVSAFRTASGSFAFQNLPGMQAYEYATNAFDPLLVSPLDQRPFLIEVKDNQRNFMSVRFRVELPLVTSGLYQPMPIGSPIDSDHARFYLFSAPSRSALPGLASIRATLTANDNETPVAYALLEVEENGRYWYGLTDPRGCVTLLFPYPTFITALGSSPPGIPPSQQQWPLTIRVRHDPTLFATLDENHMPTLRQIRNQSYALLWHSEAGSPASSLSFGLTYGQELILRTDSQSHLWIGTSSP